MLILDLIIIKRIIFNHAWRAFWCGGGLRGLETGTSGLEALF